MGRKAGNSTTNKLADTIKQGDLVWVLYRKVEWPALVKRVYLSKAPKKATYNFLPIEKHPNVFSTELKNIRPFKNTDPLPSDAGDGQRESYEIAQKIFSGELEYPDEIKSTVLPAENGKKNASSKTTSIRSNFDETSGSEAEEVEEKQSSQSDDSIFAPREHGALSAFGDKPSTSRAVGRPPTKFAEPVKPKKAEKMEKKQPEKKNLLKSDPNSIRIGLSSKKVVAEQNKKKKKKVDDVDAADNNDVDALNEDVPLNFGKDDVVVVNVEDGMWPGLVVNVMEGEVRYRPFPLKSNSVVISADVDAVALLLLDNMDVLLDSAGESKRLTEAMQDAMRFLRKRSGNNVSDDDDTKSDALINVDSVVSSSVENGNSRNVIIDSSEDKEEKTALVVEEVTKRGRKPGKRGINAAVGGEKQKHSGEPQSREGDQLTKNGKTSGSSTNVKRPKLSFFAIVTSDDTRTYLNNVWSKQIESPRHVEYIYPSRVEDLSFSFQTGGLLTLQQAEVAVSEMHKWITLCTKLPKMSQLIELHYIANFVLPEACVYALSISEALSTNEAIAKYQKLIDDERIGSANGAVKDKQANETANGNYSLNHNNGVNSGSKNYMDTSSLSSLALAAELMKNKEGIA